MDKIDFTDKVAIVTGASSGIGAETAKAFAAYKAKLTLIGRNEENLIKVAKECYDRHQLEPLCLILDLTVPGNCEAIVGKTVEKYGQVDILVNCAGKIMLTSAYDKTMDAFDELMNINFRVPYHMTQLAMPYLMKTKGNIVNIGSSVTRKYIPGSMMYGVTKNALAMFAMYAAAELRSEGVRINTISPGQTRTNILANLNIGQEYMDSTYAMIAENLPRREVLEPNEVAALVCLTASGVFPNLNGSELLIDGAASMG